MSAARSSAALIVESGQSDRSLTFDDLVTADVAERAEADANQWIKRLRHVRVDGLTLRDRFTCRGDSLWWFVELYLHKRRVVTRAFRAMYALDALAAERPKAWRVDGLPPVEAHVARLVATRHAFPCHGAPPSSRTPRGDPTLRAKAIFHTATALADRLRPARAKPTHDVTVGAFVHSAFSPGGAGDEAYAGPVLREIERRIGAGALQLIGLGPRTNFRVRRWRDRFREFTDPAARGLPLVPVGAFAQWADLQASLAQWRARGEVARALRRSQGLRAAAIVDGYDLWDVLAPELDGIADLQLPWSTRAMDEAAAALDRLRPRVVLTYAEAGGWGRALVLEARRRSIPVVALQHGFIYRHWLNYLHEPDEMVPSPTNLADRGFPLPDRTLVFDDLAREHLESRGHFPPASLVVTGSARLDALVERVRQIDRAARLAILTAIGASENVPVVVVAAKYSQIASAYGALVAAMRELPDAILVVKPHPAEGSEPYVAAARGAANVRMAPPQLSLAELTAAAAVLVTANSTAAIEAMLLDVPALVVALPNNLSPFVQLGAMAGAHGPAEIRPTLEGLLYDEMMRDRLAAARQHVIARYGIAADGHAATRAADVVLSLFGS
jgi:hypothetical protein